MSIQYLAIVGALYLTSLFVAVVAAAVYFTLQYLKHHHGALKPLPTLTLGLQSQPLGQDGCNPVESLIWSLALSGFLFAVIVGFLSGALYVLFVISRFVERHQERDTDGLEQALFVTGYVARQRPEQEAGDSAQAIPSSYGTC
uniref:Nonstructural protein 1 n=1 Tax=Citrus jingmen-like virus TaxID=1983763 RepID=A0A1W6QDW2_9VIRU|nr:nonstructural protein 1 [Citrus jingmen-like virus]